MKILIFTVDKPSDDICSTTSSTATTPSEGSELDKSLAPVQFVIRHSLLGVENETGHKPMTKDRSRLSISTTNSWYVVWWVRVVIGGVLWR